MSIDESEIRWYMEQLSNLVEERNLQEAYEIAELLFITIGYSFFFNACLSYKWQSNIEGKDLYYLTNAASNNQLVKFLQGVCFTFLKNRDNAIKSFEDSAKNADPSIKIPLYRFSYKNGRLTLNDHIGTIADIADKNLQTILKIADMSACKIIINHSDSHMPYIDSNGNLSMVDTGDQDIPASIDKKKRIPASPESPKGVAPPGTKWEDVKIVFDIDFRTLKYSFKGKQSTKVKYSDMKFPKSKSSDKPGTWWGCFVNIALIDKYVREAKSIMPDPKKDTSRVIDPDTKAPIKIHGYGSNSKTEILEASRLPSTPRADVSHVRDTLIDFFEIDDDPFYEKRKYGYHKAKFQIEIIDPDDLLNIRYKK